MGWLLVCVAISPPVEPVAQLTGREYSPTCQQLDERFTEHGPAHQSKTQFSLQLAPPTRKLTQASYPHPSEGRQKRQELQSHSL